MSQVFERVHVADGMGWDGVQMATSGARRMHEDGSPRALMRRVRPVHRVANVDSGKCGCCVIGHEEARHEPRLIGDPVVDPTLPCGTPAHN